MGVGRRGSSRSSGDTDTEILDALARIDELLVLAGAEFARVEEYIDSPFCIRAIFQEAAMYEAHAARLHDWEVPDMPVARVGAVFNAIALRIVPYEGKALETYDRGWEFARERNIDNEWTVRIYQALSRLNDVMYPPIATN